MVKHYVCKHSVCICVCMYLYVYIYIYIYIHMYVYMYTHIHMCTLMIGRGLQGLLGDPDARVRLRAGLRRLHHIIV